MAYAPTARHHLRAEDLADARYAEPLDVTDLAKAAGSPPRTLLHREGGARDSRGRVVPEMGGFRDPSGNHIPPDPGPGARGDLSRLLVEVDGG